VVSLKLPRPVVFSAVIVLLIVGAHAPWALGEPGRARAPAELDVAEILEQVTRATELPPGIGFRQEIVLRAFFSTWRFEAEVRLEPDGRVSSKTKGAPSFLPDSFAVELVELGRSPYLFDLRLIEVQDDGLYVLQGPRLKDQGSGAREATFWIDPQRWVIEKAEAAYPWGKLHVSQEYTRDLGYQLLARQKARATPFGFTLDIIYRDYQIP
jgi:hypothetical protein